jgi:hypothetical protein
MVGEQRRLEDKYVWERTGEGLKNIAEQEVENSRGEANEAFTLM